MVGGRLIYDDEYFTSYHIRLPLKQSEIIVHKLNVPMKRGYPPNFTRVIYRKLP